MITQWGNHCDAPLASLRSKFSVHLSPARLTFRQHFKCRTQRKETNGTKENGGRCSYLFHFASGNPVDRDWILILSDQFASLRAEVVVD